MKYWILLFLLQSPIINAQIISTIPGTSTGAIYNPQQLAFDPFGNLYIPTGLGHEVIKIDVTGSISVFAGTGIGGITVTIL